MIQTHTTGEKKMEPVQSRARLKLVLVAVGMVWGAAVHGVTKS